MNKDHDKLQAPFWIDPASTHTQFPDVELALTEPDGLLAFGGDLSHERLLSAYRSGIFPWYSEGQPVLWWSPDPRFVLAPKHLKISRNLRKTIRQNKYTVTINQCFNTVIEACSSIIRPGQEGTWITEEIRESYIKLHQSGYAHSVEAWMGDQLVGGLYGINIGQIFFGESMFSKKTDASKVAFALFVRHSQKLGCQLIDCQVHTAHLQSLGARMIPRSDFLQCLSHCCPTKNLFKQQTETLDSNIFHTPLSDD